MITEIKKGRSNVGTKAIQNTVIEFGIDGNWLLTGEGNIIREHTEHTEQNNTIKEHIDKIAELAGENALLKERIEQIEEQRKYTQGNVVCDYSSVAEPQKPYIKTQNKDKE